MQKLSTASTWLAMCLFIATLIPPNVHAAADEEVIAALQAQLVELSARLEALEARKAIPVEDYEAPKLTTPTASSPSWVDRIKLKGDFRYRHETIDAEFASQKRNRNRVRARPAIVADVTDTVEVGFGLATGGDSPTSSNQTLGGAFTKKPINLDLAYFDWSTPLDGLNVIAGKHKNQLHRTGGNGLIWDGDLRPEGSEVTYKNGGLKLVGMLNWVTESSSGDDLIFGGQASWKMAVGEAGELLIGAGYYDFSTAQGSDVPLNGDPLGNSVDGLNQYLYGYEEVELFGEFAFDIGGNTARIYANYVENLDAPEFEQGWIIGGSMGFHHGKRPWTLGYAYEDLEADAVFALFTDSDFAGGGTDAKGHIFRGTYGIAKNISLGGTLFINKRGENNNGIAEDYNRLMLDVEFKY